VPLKEVREGLVSDEEACLPRRERGYSTTWETFSSRTHWRPHAYGGNDETVCLLPLSSFWPFLMTFQWSSTLGDCERHRTDITSSTGHIRHVLLQTQ
jgi:hypothetical protein